MISFLSKHKSYILTLLLTLGVVYSTSLLAAPTQQTLGFQGEFFNYGTPGNAPVQATFTFHTTETGNTPSGSTITKIIPVVHGYFATEFTDTDTQGVDFNQQLYLEISINGTTLAPRTPVRPSVASFKTFGTFSHATPPTPGIAGSLYFNTTTNELYVSTGSSWQLAGTASTTIQWTPNGTSLNYMAGNVGVGTTTPESKLTVNGDITAYGPLSSIGTAGASAQLYLSDDVNGYGGIDIYSYGGGALSSPHSYINLIGSRGNTNAVSKVLAGDDLGMLNFYGQADSGLELGAAIGATAMSDFNGSSAVADLYFMTNKAERMRITSSGNVGIGTSTPNSKLVIQNAASSSLYSKYNGYGVDIIDNGLVAGSFAYEPTNATTYNIYKTNQVRVHAGNTATNGILLGTEGNSPIVFGTGLNYRMTINMNNLTAVGGVAESINMSTFTNFVTTNIVGGGLNPNGGASAYGVLNIQGGAGSGSNNAGYALNLIGGRSTGSALGGAITFSTNAAGGTGSSLNTSLERMRIDASGNVGIGTTAPTEKLVVNGNIGTNNYGSKVFFADPALNYITDVSMPASGGNGLRIRGWGGLEIYTGYGGDRKIFNFSQLGVGTFEYDTIFNANLGIGTTTPNFPLTVAGNTNLTGSISFNGTTTIQGLSLGRLSVGTNNTIGANAFNMAFGSLNTVNVGSDTTGIAVGVSNNVTGNGLGSIAVGTGNSISSYNAGSAFGIGNTVTGNRGVALGYGNTSTGDGSFGSVALGYQNNAGISSIAIGANVVNSIANTLMIGPSNTAKLTINSSGNLGVGTTTPGSLLTIAGTSQFTGSSLFLSSVNIGAPGSGYSFVAPTNVGSIRQILFDQTNQKITFENHNVDNARGGGFQRPIGTAGFTMFSLDNSTPTSGYLTFNAGGTSGVGIERMRIDGSTGNVGIGTVDPDNKLHIQGNPGDIVKIGINTTSLNDQVNIAFGDAANVYAKIGAVTHAPGQSGLAFYTSNNSGFSQPERMRIDGAGNVGIGTTSPSSKLDVYGSIRTSSAVTDYVEIDSGSIFQKSQYGDRFAIVGHGSSQLGLTGGVYDSGAIQFQTGSSKSAISGGGAGTSGLYFFTSSNFSAPEMVIQPFSGGVDISSGLRVGGNVGIGTTTPSAQLTTTGSVRFASLGSGGANLITDSLGNVTVSSDERLKDIQGDYISGLDQIKGIQPITYRWKTETGYDTIATYAGFSAQNVQQFIPEAVTTDSRGFLTLADRPILATLVNAVKELGEKFDTINSWFTDENTLTIKENATLEIDGQICVDGVCASKEQFKKLLQQASNIPVTQTTSAPAPAPEENVTEEVELEVIEEAPVVEPAPEIPTEEPALVN